MPAVVMLEDIDVVVEYASRSRHGYPARRRLEVVFEVITSKNTDIKRLYRDLRQVLFTDRTTGEINPNIAPNVTIFENRTEGPVGYGLPDVFGMRLVLDILYIDNGF